MEVYFFKRTFPRQGRVEDVEDARIPTRGGWIALKWVASCADNSPDMAFERYPLMSIERVKKLSSRARRPATDASEIGAGVHALDHAENLFGPVGIDEVYGTFIVEQRMARMKPQPRLHGGVEI